MKIHPSKTEVLTNQRSKRQCEIEIDEMKLEILPPEEKVKYSGQMITFEQHDTPEMQHRIRCAWSAFAKHRQEVTSKSYPFRQRMKQFESVVTPSMMYGAGTWTTTKELERQIRSTQLKMIRLTIQTNRKHKKETSNTVG